jgi:amidophosphoribosyltransferase
MSEPAVLDLDADRLREECGVFGIFGHPDAAAITALGLHALQHRGQEAAGIVSFDGKRFHSERRLGLVGDAFSRREVIDRLPGNAAVGHVRYSTTGETILRNVQPLFAELNAGGFAVGHNGNLTNGLTLRRQLVREGAMMQSTTDTEVILHLVAHSRERTLAGALRDALLQLEGAFSLVFLAQDRIIVARDPQGFRPLAMGQLEFSGGTPAHVFASETCAFDLINAVYMGDVQPGEMVIVGPEGVTRERYAPHRQLSQCVFEHVYFSRPDSIVFGRPVQQSRETLGMLLAREAPADADIVVPVPDSGNAAALGYASESGLPYRQALIRNHYVGRTFIEPSQAIRDFGVKLKLNAVRSLLDGKSVVLVDDSIVRGTTSRKIVRMVRQAGAREVHMRISCPPTISPCFYGVDTPNKSELIAANNTIEEIRRFIEADSLAYLSMRGLQESVADERGEYCYACYTGNYPTDFVNIEQLVRAGKKAGS